MALSTSPALLVWGCTEVLGGLCTGYRCQMAEAGQLPAGVVLSCSLELVRGAFGRSRVWGLCSECTLSEG